jgi:hypothetical protein
MRETPLKTAHCWSGAPIYCPKCNGATKALEDEYGSLSDGGSYERFECIDKLGDECGKTIYVEMPD